ncbi:sulfite reductase subunit alpha [Methylobacillus flagellatus]|uniref:NADPH--hemoprotein reductase n=1 Tax=Methylobacillus flagellatus (strain ATCC 51484 / DSM 6875 / VKM B-1610 / KT) TaxID=265072 RepID=Q1H489_METFK|nr:flavodoxin domain-containing protein [Methylobacillus flagellatus]ABE48698.1 flavodoxin/nitric oxide synthase [Methylobacillus flagellatus KT]
MTRRVSAALAGLLLSETAQAAVNNPAFNRYALALGLCIAYLLFCVWIIRRHRRLSAVPGPVSPVDGKAVLVGYASQGGYARELAFKTAAALQRPGVAVHCLALDAVDVAMLATVQRALFVVSTTGEGDPPDNARRFVQTTMSATPSLAHLQYGLLALGDSSYANFCGFGHQLDAWLQHAHALPLFDLVQVDAGDAGALRHWQYQLGLLAGNTEMPDWEAPQYQAWRLVQRKQLNPGSAGAPVYHLTLRAETVGVLWQAGDIAEIGPRNPQQAVVHFLEQLALDGATVVEGRRLSDWLQERLLPHTESELAALRDLSLVQLVQQLRPLPHREYSIASLPADGQLELLVRQAAHVDGRLGLGSGWLTRYADVGEMVALRIRENAAFHPPDERRPMILIGNGTGIAGLRAHLKARAIASRSPNWLLFGERNAAHDFYFMDEISAWQASGILSRLDTAFSRDQADKRYVQHVLASQADRLREWVAEGAAIYVCGSANGMAQAVHAVLLQALGEEAMSRLASDGRYRRDVY